jgi:hypothetical protein
VAAFGAALLLLSGVLTLVPASAGATPGPLTVNGFVATGPNTFGGGGQLKPKCPEAILSTPGSDPAAKSIDPSFDTEAFTPGDLIPYLYTDFTNSETKPFRLQDCVVTYPADMFVPGDFNAQHQLTAAFTKHELAVNATVLDSAELTDFSKTTVDGGDFTYSWQSPEDLEPGLWLCNIARDVATNHSHNKSDSDEVGNRKATPVCFQVPGDEEEPVSGITVVKTNNANDDSTFHHSEEAPGPAQDVDFKIEITNDGDSTVTISSITDAWPSHDADSIDDLSCELPFDIASGDTVTCTFTVADYSPPAGETLTNTVEVQGHVGETPVSDTDTSDVYTPEGKTATIDKLWYDAEGNAIGTWPSGVEIDATVTFTDESTTEIELSAAHPTAEVDLPDGETIASVDEDDIEGYTQLDAEDCPLFGEEYRESIVNDEPDADFTICNQADEVPPTPEKVRITKLWYDAEGDQLEVAPDVDFEVTVSFDDEGTGTDAVLDQDDLNPSEDVTVPTGTDVDAVTETDVPEGYTNVTQQCPILPQVSAASVVEDDITTYYVCNQASPAPEGHDITVRKLWLDRSGDLRDGPADSDIEITVDVAEGPDVVLTHDDLVTEDGGSIVVDTEVDSTNLGEGGVSETDVPNGWHKVSCPADVQEEFGQTADYVICNRRNGGGGGGGTTTTTEAPELGLTPDVLPEVIVAPTPEAAPVLALTPSVDPAPAPQLPFTGSDSGTLALWGTALFGLGAALLLGSRKRGSAS